MEATRSVLVGVLSGMRQLLDTLIGSLLAGNVTLLDLCNKTNYTTIIISLNQHHSFSPFDSTPE